MPRNSYNKPPVALIGKNFAEIDQDEVHDRFRLAVIVFTLLFGYEPFKGVWKGGGDPPPPPDWVKYGYWAYGSSGNVGLADYMIPLEVVHPDLKELFLRCFNDGFSVPSMRPTAREWKQALAIAYNELHQCSVVSSHFYHREHQSCYWCERKAKGFPDIFEFPQSRQGRQQSSRRNKRSATKTASDYFDRGNVKYYLEDYQGAIEDYTQAIRLKPDLAEAYYNRGLAKSDLGDKQGAIADFNEAIRLKPDYANAYNNRGLAKSDLGDKQGAIEDYREAAWLYYQQGRTANYKDALNRIRELGG